MKRRYILFSIVGLLFISACTQNNKGVGTFQDDLSTYQKTFEQQKEKNSSLNTLILEKDKEISQLQNQTEKLQKETFVLSKNKENKVRPGTELILANLHWDSYKNRNNPKIVVGVDEDTHFIRYEDMELNEDGTYNTSIISPEIPGRYIVSLIEYKPNVESLGSYIVRTYFNLTVIGKLKNQDEAIQVAKKAIGGNLVNITEIKLLDDKWYINLTVDYSFGCCGCPPGIVCTAVCRSCGTKTIDGYYIISDEGLIEQGTIKEIACKGSSNWFRNITSNELCSIDWENLN